MPNLSRRGELTMPYRVVAPTSVNGWMDRLMLRALSPLSITHETTKSSMAPYSTSSTTRLSLCTSSMNRTSCGCIRVRMETMSPGRSIAGPEVILMEASISLATMLASVVLPSPGGPYNSRWSSASLRCFDASIAISRLAFSRSWPT